MRYGESEDNRYVARGGTTALGVIGTTLGGIALAGMAGGNNGCNSGCGNNGIFSNIFGGNNNGCCYETKEASCLRQENATLRSERYTDGAILQLFDNQIKSDKEIVDYVTTLVRDLTDKVAVNEKVAFQAIADNDKNIALNKQASDYQFVITHKDIECGDEKLKCYVDCHFVPGKLIMPLSSLCPPAQPLCDTKGAIVK